MFRKQFAILGALFGIFIWASIAFPGGVIQSTYNGSAHIPTIEAIGGFSTLAILLAVISGSIIITIIYAAIIAWIARRDRLRDVADVYGMDVEELGGLEPHEAEQMLYKNVK